MTISKNMIMFSILVIGLFSFMVMVVKDMRDNLQYARQWQLDYQHQWDMNDYKCKQLNKNYSYAGQLNGKDICMNNLFYLDK